LFFLTKKSRVNRRRRLCGSFPSCGRVAYFLFTNREVGVGVVGGPRGGGWVGGSERRHALFSIFVWSSHIFFPLPHISTSEACLCLFFHSFSFCVIFFPPLPMSMSLSLLTAGVFLLTFCHTYTIVFSLTSHVHVIVISGRRSLFARRWQRVIERRRVKILFFSIPSLGFCATELGHGKHARTHTHTHTNTLNTHTCTRARKHTHARARTHTHIHTQDP
jgi:hypothetical protein